MTAPAQPRGPGGQRALDVRAEYKRQFSEGVRSVHPRADYGTVVTAVLHDTCGNLIKIAEEIRQP